MQDASLHTIALPQGSMHYCAIGSGPTVVLLHGLQVNRHIWGAIVPDLAATCRCIVPDLPLGGHTLPMPAAADLTPLGLAQLIADFLAALDLHNVILVGSDTGGALTQLLLTRHPERLAGAVLLNCDAYHDFLPPVANLFQLLPHIPGGVRGTVALLQHPLAQWLLMIQFAHSGITLEQGAAYFRPAHALPDVRRDLTKVLRGISNRYTLAAARAFPAVQQPVLIVWGKDDLFFSRRNAKRLQRDLPNATLEWVERSRTFVQLDQPARLVELVSAFAENYGKPSAAIPPRPEPVAG